MNPLEFMLAPHSITDAEYNSWGNGVPYAKGLLKGLNYEEFNMPTLCLPLLFRYMLNPFFFFSFSFALFVMAYNGGKLVTGGAYC